MSKLKIGQITTNIVKYHIPNRYLGCKMCPAIGMCCCYCKIGNTQNSLVQYDISSAQDDSKEICLVYRTEFPFFPTALTTPILRRQYAIF